MQIPYARSELHLTEALEKVCNKMDNYVQATYKSSGKLMLLELVTENGRMNPDFDKVDIVKDPDLNKGLKFYVSLIMCSCMLYIIFWSIVFCHFSIV